MGRCHSHDIYIYACSKIIWVCNCLIFSFSPWASRSNSDTGWPDSGSIESGQPDKDWPITSQSNSFSDLVPEFEPGKPWKVGELHILIASGNHLSYATPEAVCVILLCLVCKFSFCCPLFQGNQLKSIEDDPSITPGSVVRSPLSLAALKEPEMFSSGGVSKTSPTSSGAEILPPLSLSSSTWSYNNTASSTASSFARLVKPFFSGPPPFHSSLMVEIVTLSNGNSQLEWAKWRVESIFPEVLCLMLESLLGMQIL